MSMSTQHIGPVFKEILDYDKDEWRSQALCRGMDTNIFFEDGSEDADKSDAFFKREHAKSICAKCPVSAPCLDFALDNDIRDGIYGGVTYRNRLTIKRMRNKMNRKKEEDNAE